MSHSLYSRTISLFTQGMEHYIFYTNLLRAKIKLIIKRVSYLFQSLQDLIFPHLCKNLFFLTGIWKYCNLPFQNIKTKNNLYSLNIDNYFSNKAKQIFKSVLLA